MESQARIAADALVLDVNLAPGTTLNFLRMEDGDDEITVVYEKVSAEPTKELPATVKVIYDKSNGKARLLYQE